MTIRINIINIVRQCPDGRKRKKKKLYMHEDRLAQIDEVINNGIYKDTWESIAAYPVP